MQLVEVTRRDDESPEAWRQVIQDIVDTAGVRIEHLHDGTVRIGGRKYCEGLQGLTTRRVKPPGSTGSAK
ncbi:MULTISPECIES: DUF1654 domain-containing protein [Pseudomonas]|uniref:DUF1654 domain-containing protein n=1 Tax=Pseudomonas TaxID=286 RepID=UPI00351F099E